jgi:LacI family transcriptional regulator
LLGGLEALRHHGLHVPQDVSVVTFDDVEPLTLFDPPITAVRQPIAEMSGHAVSAILAKKTSSITERLPVSLIVRSSVVAPKKLRRVKVR